MNIVRNEEIEMIKFIITVTMDNGDKWETIRHTRDGLREVIKCIWKDNKVASFSVLEKVVA
jgi:hypothetical protein